MNMHPLSSLYHSVKETSHLVQEKSALKWFLLYIKYLKVVIEVSKLNDDVTGCDREGEVNLQWQRETTQGN